MLLILDEKAISIDAKYPGNQGEGIYAAARFWGFEKDSFVYEGVNIELLVDIRDVEESNYSMEVVDGGNVATLTVPVLPATFRKDKQEHEARIAADNQIKKAHDVLWSAYSKLPKDAQVEKLKLIFPPEWKLTQRPLVSGSAVHDKGTAERVKPKLVIYKCDTAHKDSGGSTIYQLFGRLYFKLCNASTATAMQEAEKDAGADTVTDGLAGL